MEPYSDLNAILQDGHSLQYDMKFQGIQNVTISTRQIGELVLTSGRIIACDPLIGPDTRYHFQKAVKPGRYPVIISVADFQPVRSARTACAMLRFSDEATVRWEVALINEPVTSQADYRTTYWVDAGTGCFMDLEAAQVLEDLFPKEDEFEAVCDRVVAEMEKSPSPKWTNVQVSNDTDANMIAFASGWGDGDYASFWGHDAAGNLTSLVTDFALFPQHPLHLKILPT